jgi:hypothetical protein
MAGPDGAAVSPGGCGFAPSTPAAARANDRLRGARASADVCPAARRCSVITAKPAATSPPAAARRLERTSRDVIRSACPLRWCPSTA